MPTLKLGGSFMRGNGPQIIIVVLDTEAQGRFVRRVDRGRRKWGTFELIITGIGIILVSGGATRKKNVP